MNVKTFFRELRRRNVYKVAASYAVIAWLLVQAVSVMLFGHEERSGAVIALFIIVLIGFFLAIYISWAFEATPQGMKRTENVPSDATLPTWSRRKYGAFLIVTALLAASLLVIDIYRSRTLPSTTTSVPLNH